MILIRNNNIEKICEVCKKPFSTKWKNQKYCSVICRFYGIKVRREKGKLYYNDETGIFEDLTVEEILGN